MIEDSILDRQSRYTDANQEHGARQSTDQHPPRSPGFFSYFANVTSPLTVGAARLLQARPFSGRATPPAAASEEPEIGLNDPIAPSTVPDLQDGSNLRKAKRVVAHPNDSFEAVLSDGGAAESQQEPSIELGVELPRPADSAGGGLQRIVQATNSGAHISRPTFESRQFGSQQITSHDNIRNHKSDPATRPAPSLQPGSHPVQNPYSKLMQAVRRGQHVGGGTSAEMQPFAAAASPRFPPRPAAYAQPQFNQSGSHDCALVSFDGQSTQQTAQLPPRPDPFTPVQSPSLRPLQSSHPRQADATATAPRSKNPETASSLPEPASRRMPFLSAQTDRPSLLPVPDRAPPRRAGPRSSAPGGRAVVQYTAPAPPPASSSVTWIPTYTRSLARRRAARVTFKPNPGPGRTSLLPAPPARQSKRSRDGEAENVSPGGTSGRAIVRRRTMQGEEVSKQAKEIAHHILEAVNHIAQSRDTQPEYGGLRHLTSPRPPPPENPPALTAGAWENLRNVALPDARQVPLLSHLTPCTSVQAELARREHEQRVQNQTAATPSQAATGGADGFTFPAAQAVTELMQQANSGTGAHTETASVGVRAALDAFGMMAGPPRSLKPPMSIAQAMQQRRDEEAAAEKRRADALPKMPADPQFDPPQPAGADVMPTLDAFMEARRKVGLPKPTNPCDFLKPLPGEEEPPSPRSTAEEPPVEPILRPSAAAPAPAVQAQPVEPPKPAGTPAVQSPAGPTETRAEPAQPDRPVDERPAKRRAPVVNGWGDAFLKQNKAAEAATQDAIAKEIESQNPLANKPSGPSVSFGSDVPVKVSVPSSAALFQPVADSVKPPAGAPAAATSASPLFGGQPAASVPASAAASPPAFSFPASSSATAANKAAATAPASAAGGAPPASAPLFGAPATSAPLSFGAPPAASAPIPSPGPATVAQPGAAASSAPAASANQDANAAQPATSGPPLFNFGAPAVPSAGAGGASAPVTSGTLTAGAGLGGAPAGSLFGSPLQTAPADGASAAAPANLFGSAAGPQPATSSAPSPLFGAAGTQASHASSAAVLFPFGTQPSTSAGGAAASTSLFGAPAPAAAAPAASQPSSVPQFTFGGPQAPAQKEAAKPIVFPGTLGPAGGSSAAPAEAAPPPFGAPASSAAPAQGAPASAPFGGFGASSASSMFGASSADGAGFGGAAAPGGGSTGASLFSGIAPAAAGAASSSSLFGGPMLAPVAPASSAGFPGAASAPAAAVPSMFGSGQGSILPGAAAGGLGAAQPNPFATGGNAFGAASSAAGFGAAPAPGAGGFVFGSNPQSAPFGQQQPAAASGAAFGSPSPAGGLFGSTGMGAGAPNPFNQIGQAPTQGPAQGFQFGATPGAGSQPGAGGQQPFTTPAFGAPAAGAAAQGNAFGAAAGGAGFGGAGQASTLFGAAPQAQAGPAVAAPFGAPGGMFGAGQAPGGPAPGGGGAGQSMPSFMAGANAGAFSMGPSENRGAGRRGKIAVRRRHQR